MVLPCWFRRRSRGSARNGRAVKALPTALRMRHEKRNSQNEPGMCPGINRLTFWCGPQTRSPRLAHIAKGAMYAPPEAGLGCASAPNRWERSRNVSWNQSFHEVRAGRLRGRNVHADHVFGWLILLRVVTSGFLFRN